MSLLVNRIAAICASITVAILLALGVAHAAAAEPRIAVIEFEMMKSDLLPGGAWPTPEEATRMQRTAEQVRQMLRDAGYQVIPGEQTRAAIAANDPTQYLHACNGCERDIAAAVGADWVVVGWAQIVSYLIQNLNVVATGVGDGRTLARGFVDLRGNTDESFARATRYLMDNLVLERLSRHR